MTDLPSAKRELRGPPLGPVRAFVCSLCETASDIDDNFCRNCGAQFEPMSYGVYGEGKE